MEDIYKEVYFDKYCGSCKYEDSPEKDDSCQECLNNPVNLYSHKPVNWKKNEYGTTQNFRPVAAAITF